MEVEALDFWLNSAKSYENFREINFLPKIRKIGVLTRFLVPNLIPRNTGIDSGIEALIPKTGIENKSVFWNL